MNRLTITNLSRRLGKFYVTNELLEDSAEMLLAQLSPHIFTVRCEAIWHMGCLEITAFSPHFDIVEQWENPPTYQAEFEDFEVSDGCYEERFVKFTRIAP